jgi:hypothetical protein
MMMKYYIIIILFALGRGLVAEENSKTVYFEPNLTKHVLINSSYQDADSLISENKEEKSVIQAALYSAVIPGAGQYYAGSTWKAILFAGIEVAAWTAYIVYSDKASDQEAVMESFANANWSEQRYWSKLYYEALQRGISTLPVYRVDENNILIDYDADVIESLRFLEDALGHSHKLPETKTQQYYEMIYKYLTQFGNGWADADFYREYYGNTNNMTAQMFQYRDMRNDMNSYYDNVSTVTNIILLNHVLSALDAAWTARGYNREIKINIRAYNKRYLDENVQMLGVNIAW